MQDPIELARPIKVVIFDVDGVLTDGNLFLGDDGQEYKAFYSRDGHGMVMLRDSGVTIAIITGRRSEVVRIRMQSLGIEHVHQGCRDKLPAYQQLKASLGVEDSQVAYVGDDIVDLPVMRRVGFAVSALAFTKSRLRNRASSFLGSVADVPGRAKPTGGRRRADQ